MNKLTATLSLDLDDKWSYMKTHGDKGWDSYPSFLADVVPRILAFLAERELTITFFIVGQDAAFERNHAVLQAIADEGHEIANHSFHHEPWLRTFSRAELANELGLAEQAIFAATGKQVKGFRGPSFSSSPTLLAELAARGYSYDASSFPTFLGPLARLYFFLSSSLSRRERAERRQLFGTLADGFKRLRPHEVSTSEGSLLEIPVTTMPLARTPIHLSYLHFLAKRSRWLAMTYFRLAIGLCRIARVEPSLLLHALDFWGCDDDDQLGYFPGMTSTSRDKISLVSDALVVLAQSCEIIPLEEFAARQGPVPCLTDGLPSATERSLGESLQTSAAGVEG